MNNDFEDKLDRLIRTSWKSRENDAPKQIGQIKVQNAARGSFLSSGTVLQVDEILCRELEARAILVWQAIVRVHKIVGLGTNPDIATYFKDIFNRYNQETLNELLPIFENETKMIKMSYNSRLPEVANMSKDKHDIEIDLYLATLKDTKEVSATQPATYNFYGNVGAVQSGAGSTANVVQNLAETDKQEIVNALHEVKLAIQNLTDKEEREINELVEVVDESIEELQKTNPNNTKLYACFNILSGSIQAIANAGPAYQALKNALLPLGIVLP